MHLLPVPFRLRAVLLAMRCLPWRIARNHPAVCRRSGQEVAPGRARDLSKCVCIDDQALSVKVVATDDQHWQKNTADKRSWDGDGIILLMPSSVSSTWKWTSPVRGRNHIFLRRCRRASGHEAALQLATERWYANNLRNHGAFRPSAAQPRLSRAASVST